MRRLALAAIGVTLLLWMLGIVLPSWVIGSGLEGFGDPGNRERRMASRALLHGAELHGSGFLEIGDYNGPPLVLGWHVKSVKECPERPPGKRIEKDSYRAYAGASARIGAYTVFGIPRGEMEVTCTGRREWTDRALTQKPHNTQWGDGR